MSYVYILRHGEAVPPSSVPDADFKRVLSPRGNHQLQELAQNLKAQDEPIETIYHSPYIRTTETAMIFNKAFPVGMRRLDCLVPDGDAQEVINHLLGEEKNVLLVSHMPLVGELVMHMARKMVNFYPGSCIKIARDAITKEAGSIEWMI